MKQQRDINNDWQDDSDTPRRRWLRRLRNLLVFAALGSAAYATGWLDVRETAIAAAVVPGLGLIWRGWSARRDQRRWRSDGILVEPSLPSPVSRIPEETEWRWPSHPLIKVPLALLLIGLLYWALVQHRLQVPAPWPLALALLALINLWCWREPLLLAALVAAGVGLLALLGWMIALLSLPGAIAALLGGLAAAIVAAAEIRKRTKRPTR